jgi:hypothetical protein
MTATSTPSSGWPNQPADRARPHAPAVREWLRPEGSRTDARRHLRTAHDQLVTIGMARSRTAPVANWPRPARPTASATTTSLRDPEKHSHPARAPRPHQPRHRLAGVHQLPHRRVASAQRLRRTGRHQPPTARTNPRRPRRAHSRRPPPAMSRRRRVRGPYWSRSQYAPPPWMKTPSTPMITAPCSLSPIWAFTSPVPPSTTFESSRVRTMFSPTARLSSSS